MDPRSVGRSLGQSLGRAPPVHAAPWMRRTRGDRRCGLVAARFHRSRLVARATTTTTTMLFFRAPMMMMMMMMMNDDDATASRVSRAPPSTHARAPTVRLSRVEHATTRVKREEDRVRVRACVCSRD